MTSNKAFQSRQDLSKSDDFWEYSKPISFNFEDDINADFLTESMAPMPVLDETASTGILSGKNVVDSVKLVDPEEADKKVVEYQKYFERKQVLPSTNFSRISTVVKRIVAGENPDIHLFKSREDKLALLDAAIDCYDGNAILSVLVFLEKTLCWRIFVSEVMSRPVAIDHYIDYLSQTSKTRELTDFLAMFGRNEEAAMVNYANAIKCDHMETKIKNLKHCHNNFFKDLHDDLYLPAIVEQINLYERQMPVSVADSKGTSITEQYSLGPSQLLGSSVIYTLFYCILYHYKLSENNLASPEAIKKVHSLSEKQFYWTALRALSKLKRWSDVESLFQYQTFFGNKKIKQIISFDQIVRTLAKEGAPYEVLTTFLRLISDEKTRIKLSQEFHIN